MFSKLLSRENFTRSIKKSPTDINSKLAKLLEKVIIHNVTLAIGLAELDFLNRNPIFYSNEKEIIKDALSKMSTIAQVIFLLSLYLAEKIGVNGLLPTFRILEKMLNEEENYYGQVKEILNVIKMRLLMFSFIVIISMIVYYEIAIILENIPFELLFILFLNWGLTTSYMFYWLEIISRVLFLPISISDNQRIEN